MHKAHPGQGANVVLVAVRDDEGLDLVPPLVQEGAVRQQLLHAVVGEAAAHAPVGTPQLLVVHPAPGPACRPQLPCSVHSLAAGWHGMHKGPGMRHQGSACAHRTDSAGQSRRCSPPVCAQQDRADALREHQAGVDEDVTVAHAHQHAVHADLAQASYGQYAQGWALACAAGLRM